MNINQLKEGDRVLVQAREGFMRVGTVTEVSDNIKKGFAGITYEDARGSGWWCYHDQIVRKIEAEKAA